MRIGVVGSRGLTVDLRPYLDSVSVSEIVSGGCRGVDACAEKYARENGILIRIFHPDYKRYGCAAPLYRNVQIVDFSDKVYIFWDGVSRGTKFVLDYCVKSTKSFSLTLIDDSSAYSLI